MSSSSKKNYLIIGLAIYAITVSILLLNSWLKDSKQVLEHDKNFKYTFNADNTMLYQYDKSTDALIYTQQDKNLDFNPEKTEYYAQGVGPLIVWRDYNEDGYPESCYYYSIDQKYAGKSLDNDSDGLDEYQEILLQNGDTLFLTDRNKDGIWERDPSKVITTETAY